MGCADVPSMAFAKYSLVDHVLMGIVKFVNKKIIFVSNTSWYLFNFRLELMKTLMGKGYEVIAVAPYDEYVAKLKEEGFRFISVEMDRKKLNPAKDLKFFRNLYKIYKKEKPQIVVHYTTKPNICGAIAAKLTKVKCINTVTGLGWLFIEDNWFSKLAKFLYRISFKFPEKIFFQNEDDLKFFVKNRLVNEPKTILIKGSGVDIDYFHPDYCKEFKKDDSIIFLFLGRLLRDKGVGEFADAASILKNKYPDAKFWILGNIDKGNPAGITREKLREWEKLESIEYLGFVDDVRQVICLSDVIVLPSYREGIPRSLLEAASMEKPIITTNSIGCKEVVEESINGFLVPVKDSKALAGAMKRMIEIGEDRRKQMGKAGRQKMLEEFDEKTVIARYLEIIETISKQG
jgi:glycosyltransferase involved in cell wall biosynthesis